MSILEFEKKKKRKKKKITGFDFLICLENTRDPQIMEIGQVKEIKQWHLP